ncbi:unnamed protein product [Vitrella brassicaformis CCMP3155]|uniref:Uncharacterized protein n=1 Tax=Vitrella brassicaformis (strain CCMP3155) TaxID=1169540 RepID=A0A0G4ESN0_VITBC|nr:unnamed protein product [Vitrella brassicaformis CCMP3155]|eukprot:CEM01642.1 unnamed protein product [Vitrella brassicaformis CCMP3155]
MKGPSYALLIALAAVCSVAVASATYSNYGDTGVSGHQVQLSLVQQQVYQAKSMMEQAHKMGEAAHEMASTALDAIRSAHRQMHLISGAQPERCNPPLWARRALSRRCLPRPPPLFHHYGVRQGHRLSGRTALLRWCLQGGGGVRSLSTVTTVSARPLGLAGGEIPSIRDFHGLCG